jgi:selenide,water dikinase
VQGEIELQKDLMLVGGGHSHALVLLMLAMKPIEGLRTTLISPASHTPYSGMLPGLIAGHYTFEDSHIDLARLCQWAGVRFIRAEVTALDTNTRQLSLANRPLINYDILSLDIGSQPELDSVPGARQYATPVKPVASLWQRWQLMRERVTDVERGEPYRISMVGGGAGSVELALAMAMAKRLEDENIHIDLWCGATEILQGYNASSRRSVMAAMAQHGVDVHLNSRVVQVTDTQLQLQDGASAAYDDLFWCTGAAAAPWVAASGLPTDDRGFLTIHDTLQSVADETVFGAGDIATQVHHPRPKAGVYAVRQAPVLAYNLRSMLLGNPLRSHKPQQNFLSLISLGDKTATADRGPFSVSGSWVWRWKNRIDTTFMSRFENLPAMMPIANWGKLPELEGADPQAICGGCGAKVGADDLANVLRQLSLDYPDHCVGTRDDTAEIPNDGQPVMQSVDVLRNLVSDPWLMGRIAANHALSDLYASGARPVSALATVTLPYASGALLQRELQQLLAGALHEFSKVGCRLNGGHSMQGPELNIGFVVNGVPIAADGNQLAKTTPREGDVLVLTKPLGTGILFAAHMQLIADGRDVAVAEQMMMQSNMKAAELAIAHRATACTDITGFGLLGHLLEMLDDKLGAELILNDLPVLPGVLEMIESGTQSTAHKANMKSGESFLEKNSSANAARVQLLFDPQTSGGLLIALPGGSAQKLCSELTESGCTEARIIGAVCALPSGAAIVRAR